MNFRLVCYFFSIWIIFHSTHFISVMCLLSLTFFESKDLNSSGGSNRFVNRISTVTFLSLKLYAYSKEKIWASGIAQQHLVNSHQPADCSKVSDILLNRYIASIFNFCYMEFRRTPPLRNSTVKGVCCKIPNRKLNQNP